MSEQKRYTAQEMREEAWYEVHCGLIRASNMLRQAADAEEERASLIASLKEREQFIKSHESAILLEDTICGIEAENKRLKARLEAVVKECENTKAFNSCKHKMDEWKERGGESGLIERILRAARGEGGAE